MAALEFGKDIAAVSCRSKLRIFSCRNSSDVVRICEDLSSQNDNSQQQGESHREGDTKRTVDPNQTQPDGQILCCSLSKSGEYFTCCDDNKFIYLWETHPWRLLSKRTIQKRATAVTFTTSEEHILLADKFGDVYQFSVKSFDEAGVLLLGHVSMLLDLTSTPDDKFVISCDRDEKIRVSCLPNAYNIHGYCLGHTQFVSCLQIVPGKENLLVSAGGDSSLKLWDYRDCRLLTSTEISHKSKIKKDDEFFTVTHLSCSKEGYVALSLLGEKVLLIYKLSEDSTGFTFHEASKMNFDSEVLCMTFDPESFLWIIQSSPEKTVQVFQLVEGREELQVTLLKTLTEVWKSTLLHSLNQDSDFFKNPLKGEHPLSSLHKKSFDNVKEYMDRKQQRIAEEEIRKEKYEARLERQAQRKRLKVENTDKMEAQS